MIKRLLILCSLVPLLSLLSACREETPPALASISSFQTPTSIGQSKITPAISANAAFQEYSLPQPNSGVMRPVIDHKGQLWFGEMAHNHLTLFDPLTEKFEQMTPPNGASGIMGIAVAEDNTIWFAEQYANYIGHYFPDKREYRTYPLPILQTPDSGNPKQLVSLPSAPNDIALDQQGNVWFTEMNADCLGMLDIKTGHFKHYPLSPQKTIQKINPYGITIDRKGMIWFTAVSSSNLGRLDPRTGKIRYFASPDTDNQLMEVVTDANGTIWATSFSEGLLISFDTRAESFTTYYSPYTGHSAGGLYGIAISPNNTVWVTITSENTLARLDQQKKRFVYYHIPGNAGLPLGVTTQTDQTIWFTEAGSNKLGKLIL